MSERPGSIENSINPEARRHHPEIKTPKPDVKRGLPMFRYVDPETKNRVSVIHPELPVNLGNNSKLISPDQEIPVRLPAETVRLWFKDYLAMLGSNYQDYESAMRHPDSKEKNNNSKVLTELHRFAITDRLKTAHEAIKLGGFIEREMSTGETDGHIVNMVNESGYGRAMLASPQSDHVDKIDFFIQIDPKRDLGMPGKPVHFGVQHTLLQRDEEKLAYKKEIVERKPEVYIPEHPEFGLVTKTFIQDRRADFYPENAKHSLDSILQTIKRKEKRKPHVWEAWQYNTDGTKNSITENEARHTLDERISDIYERILGALKEYVESTSNPFFRKDLEYKIKIVEAVLEKMEQGSQAKAA